MTRNPIDQVLRELAARTEEVDAPGEDAVLAYLAGTASELEAREVRAAILASPAYRDTVVQLSADLRELAGAELARAFDAADPGKPPPLDSFLGAEERGHTARTAARAATAPVRENLRDRIRSLFARPVYAVALAALLVLVALPWLRSRPDVVLPGAPAADAPMLVVRAMPPGEFRGDESLRLPEAPATHEELVLHLEAPAPAGPGDLIHVALSDSRGEVWRSREPRRFESIGGDVFLVLAVAPGRLRTGDVSVTLVDLGGTPLAHYRFRVTER